MKTKHCYNLQRVRCHNSTTLNACRLNCQSALHTKCTEENEDAQKQTALAHSRQALSLIINSTSTGTQLSSKEAPAVAVGCVCAVNVVNTNMKVCCVVFCIIVLFHFGLTSEKAKKLHEDILHKSGYNKVIRPVINASDHIDVQLGLKLSQLIDVVSSHSSNCVIT